MNQQEVEKLCDEMLNLMEAIAHAKPDEDTLCSLTTLQGDLELVVVELEDKLGYNDFEVIDFDDEEDDDEDEDDDYAEWDKAPTPYIETPEERKAMRAAFRNKIGSY